jgi:hypothetical protein
MLARFHEGLVVANFVMSTSNSLLSSIFWSKRTICWIFRNKDTFYRISTSCICRTTRIDIVVGYFRLFENTEKHLCCNFENKLRTAFGSRVKLEYHLFPIELCHYRMAWTTHIFVSFNHQIYQQNLTFFDENTGDSSTSRCLTQCVRYNLRKCKTRKMSTLYQNEFCCLCLELIKRSLVNRISRFGFGL